MPFKLDTLRTILVAENDALRTFIEVLRKEQQALLQGETDHLCLFAEPKAQLALKLTCLGEQWLRLLRDCGVTPDRAGLQQVLKDMGGNTARETQQWEQLLQLAASANQLNTTNGVLIAARLSTTQRALHTLFSAARLPATYTPNGGTIACHSTHQIAVA